MKTQTETDRLHAAIERDKTEARVQERVNDLRESLRRLKVATVHTNDLVRYLADDMSNDLDALCADLVALGVMQRTGR